MTIRELTSNDLDRAAETLGQAFENDPMVQWMSPDAATRARFTRQFTRVPLRYGHRFGRVTESNDAQAVSIWIPPERPLNLTGLIRCGMLAMPFQIGFGPYSRFLGAPWSVVD
ncbi:MAG: hypothetical protein WBW88_14655 [Rhodothermales bacterium]